MDKLTYRQEIESGLKKLDEVLQGASGEDWKKVVDHHQRNISSYSVHSEHLTGYVAEVVSSEGNASYIAMADPGFGRRIANLLEAMLGDTQNWGLDLIEQHETCDRSLCPIGAAVELVRYIEKKA